MVNRFAYGPGSNAFERGDPAAGARCAAADIIVFKKRRYPEEPEVDYISGVVGLPARDVWRCARGMVYVTTRPWRSHS